MEMSPSAKEAGLSRERDDFAALFAMLDEPLDQGTAHAGYARLMGRVASEATLRHAHWEHD